MKRTLIALAAFLLLATGLQAAVYTVTLASGASFETRYRPVEADWDSDYMVMMTDQGNLIALPKADVVDVTSDFEARGFGYQLDTSTVMLGYTANEGPLPGEDGGEAGPGAPRGSGGPGAPAQQPQAPPRQDFSVQQFVNPGDAGGGLPANYYQQGGSEN